ncbi:MAG: glycosyltransferase [Desulfovibrionaceae bacterium]
MIHVALGVRNTNNYFVHSLVCVCSVLSNASVPVHIHLIHDSTLSPEDRACCSLLVNHFHATLTLHPVNIDASALAQLVPDCFGLGCLYRLFIPESIPADRVIYFDSDICCHMDVADIIAEAERIQDFSLLVVQDEGICREVFSRYIQKHGINPRIYFNSGFLVFNIPRINSEIPHFFDSIVNVIRTTGKLRFGDQDALNLYFLQQHAPEAQSGLHYLPERFNLNIGVKDRHLRQPQSLANTVVHYAYIKPWEKIFPAAMIYWKYREKMFAIIQNTPTTPHM